MGIIWSDGPYAGRVLHEGHVLATGVRSVRVMSDVYDDEGFAEVWTGEEISSIYTRDWWYRKIGGGWTKDHDEAIDGEWVPTDNITEGGYYQKEQVFVYATVVVDATPEVREAVASFNATNNWIYLTETALKNAISLDSAIGKEVMVFTGRKIPLGIYEITSRTFDGSYGTSVNVRNKEGKHFSYINVSNMRVHQPERYVEGPVTCRFCRKTSPSIEDAGMLCGRGAICKACFTEQVLDGKKDISLPSTAKNPYHSAFKGRTPLRGTGVGEQLVRHLIDHTQEEDVWLMLTDWIEDDLEEYDRADQLRIAIRGKPKKREKSIRLKDLKVTPWEKITETVGFERWLCRITGFPPTEHFDEVTASAYLMRVNNDLRFTGISYRGVKTGDPVPEQITFKNRVKGILLRQIKQVVKLPEPVPSIGD